MQGMDAFVQLVVQKKEQEEKEKNAEMDQLQAGIAALKVQQQQQQREQERQRRKEEDKRLGTHELSLIQGLGRRTIEVHTNRLSTMNGLVYYAFLQ